MFNEADPDQVAALLDTINARSAELIEDLAVYRGRFALKQQDDLAFEGWAIQKIAGIQVALEMVASDVRVLVERAGQK